MGCFRIGERVCNNCVHWRCHSARKFQGNPPREVYTTSNCDKCSLTNRATLSSNTCAAFSHIGGVQASATFVSPPKPDYNPGMAYLNAVMEFARDRQMINAAERMMSRELDDTDDEYERERDRINRENRRKLLNHGMSASAGHDEQVEFRVLLENAAKGDSEAQFYLAWSFHRGEHGAIQDDERAAKWCWKAVRQDDARAEHLMGRFYLQGKGVARNVYKAEALFERAIARGCDAARDDLCVVRRIVGRD